MNPMHQPTQIKLVNHGITLEGTDVEITRFLEYIESEWLGVWQTLYNFTDVKYDLGHDVLYFTTNSGETSLIKAIIKLSTKFPNIFMMYDYYVDDENDDEDGVFYLTQGQLTTGPV